MSKIIILNPLSDSSLLLARSFHRLVFFEDRKKMTFAQPLGASSGVFLCRHISSSSSSSCKPEESSIKIDALGDVVPDGSVQAMVNNLTGWSPEMKNFYPLCTACSV
ncbi:hypothetical protein Bca4012_022371 [Brassica carinata]